MIARDAKNPDKLGFAEQILTDLGAKNGFEVTCSKDGALFSPEYVAKFDALAFYTTGDLLQDSPKPPDNGTKMSAAGKAAFLDAIKNGKGFLGLHSGSDTFHSNSKLSKELIRNVNDKGEDAFDPYIQMLGGEFITHGAQQKSTLKLVDPKFPGAAGLGGANFQEEWYALKNFAPDLHVILVQETAGMNGGMYQRKPYPENLGPHARQGAGVLHLARPSRGCLAEARVPRAARRRDELDHRKSRRRDPGEYQGGLSRGRREAARRWPRRKRETRS